MKQIFLSIAILLAGITASKAQNTFPSTGSVGIGITTPAASALLEVKSTTKGILIPRMTSAQRVAIVSPATGLLVYQTDGTIGFYVYNAGWKQLLTSAANTTLSNLSTTTAVNRTLLPGTTASINLGSLSKKWKKGYFSDSLISGSLTAGSASAATGVTGTGNSSGVYGSSTNSGYGVYGSSDANENANGSTGVYGTAFYGVYGTGTYGTYGDGSYIGAYATGQTYGAFGYGATGVYGGSSSGTGYGVDGQGYRGVNGIGSYVGVWGAGDSYGGVFYGGPYGVYAKGTSYAGYFVGNVYASGTYTGSDKNLKKNIKEFSSALDIINKLKPRQYEFRHDGNYEKMDLPTGNHYGLIAQDVEQILPNLVKDTKFENSFTKKPYSESSDPKKPAPTDYTETKSEPINFKALNYTELIPILIKGMQEQDVKIKEQETKIANLESEINDIKSMILSGNNATSSLSGYLKQNIPNPSNNSTTIAYAVPGNTARSEIRITDAKGSSIKTYIVRGAGQLTIKSGELPVGAYNYTLYANNKVIDTKQMVVGK